MKNQRAAALGTLLIKDLWLRGDPFHEVTALIFSGFLVPTAGGATAQLFPRWGFQNFRERGAAFWANFFIHVNKFNSIREKLIGEKIDLYLVDCEGKSCPVFLGNDSKQFS